MLGYLNIYIYIYISTDSLTTYTIYKYLTFQGLKLEALKKSVSIWTAFLPSTPAELCVTDAKEEIL